MVDMLRCCDRTLVSVTTRISLGIHEVCGWISGWGGGQGGGGRDGETPQDGLPRASHLGTETPDKVDRNAINSHLCLTSLVASRPQGAQDRAGSEDELGMSSQAKPKRNQNFLFSSGWGNALPQTSM